MSLQRVPRVWFRLELPSTPTVRRARLELVETFEKHLSARFAPVRKAWLHFLAVSQLTVTADEKQFVVAIASEARRGRDERAWLLTINPAAYPVPIRSLPKDEERKYSKGLMLISSEIESVPGHRAHLKDGLVLVSEDMHRMKPDLTSKDFHGHVRESLPGAFVTQPIERDAICRCRRFPREVIGGCDRRNLTIASATAISSP